MLAHLKHNKKLWLALATTMVIVLFVWSLFLQQSSFDNSSGQTNGLEHIQTEHRSRHENGHHHKNHNRLKTLHVSGTRSHHRNRVGKTVRGHSHLPKRKPSHLRKDAISSTGVKMAAQDEDHHKKHNSNAGFDAAKVLSLFSTCRKDGDILLIDCYVDAYEELCKLFKLFGTVFTFVTSDVEEKIGILRVYRKEENAAKYDTIQSMLAFEVEKDITASKKRPSGARTLLRLHRALEFISALLVKIRDTDNHSKFSQMATKAYDDTLAKHHPWLIKKAVHVAMYMLPSRADLLKKMNVEDNEKGMESMTQLIDELNIIYNITQALYAKDKLLDLP